MSTKPRSTLNVYLETKVDPKIVKPVMTVDNEVVPGAQFYADIKWILPGAKGDIKLCDSHTHKFGEMLGFYGYNYDNINDLGAEIELLLIMKKCLG